MVKLKWKTETRIIKSLLPTGFNPRKINKQNLEALKQSIDKFDLVDIPVINFDNSLISGHQRIEAFFLLERENEEIDIRYPNRQLTEQETKEYMLIANTHAGEFDAEVLEAEFQDIEIAFAIPIEKEKKKNQEIDVSTFKEEMQMKLTFTNANFLRVKQKLSDITMTPEAVILKYLFNE